MLVTTKTLNIFSINISRFTVCTLDRFLDGISQTRVGGVGVRGGVGEMEKIGERTNLP